MVGISAGVMEKYLMRAAVKTFTTGIQTISSGRWLKITIKPVTNAATSKWPMTLMVAHTVRPSLVFMVLFVSEPF